MIEEIKRFAIASARDEGDRVVINGKTAWAGLGNRSGLHDFQWTLVREKWEKSGERFVKNKLDKLAEGDVVEILIFRNINRDRGRWVVSHRMVV